jgi:N-methylhydantoinase A
LSTAAAAWTIHDVVNETMASAVRMHVSERGGDPSRLVVVAFGGAGPVHVCNLARKLRIGRILVPLRAGVLSALGLVLAPAAYDIARTRKTPLRGLDFRALADDVADMQAEIAAKLQEVANVSATFEVALGLGYIGQSYHVPVSVDGETIATLTVGKILARFADEYRGKYGYYYDDVPVELVTVHVTGVADTETRALPVLEMSGGDASSGLRTRREAYSARKGAQASFAVYTRDRLKPGMTFEGPCLIEEESATTVVDVDARVTIDRYGSLDIAVGSTE